MEKSMKTKLFIIVILLLVIANLTAFDGNRKGFLLGFGAGGGNVSFKQTIVGNSEDITSDTESEIGFVTDFKIGFAPNNNLEIYYSSKVAWFSLKNVNTDDVTISDGLGALSLSYFFTKGQTWRPSPFISGGFGFSAWNAPFEEGSVAWTGSGFFVGGGYEFSKHFRIGLDLFKNNPSHNEMGYTFTTNSTVIMLTLCGMAF
jgi:hypothetical protein